MGRCRIVTPEVVRLPLSDGDYLDVKKELNAGEWWDLIATMSERKPFSKILAYAIGWSLIGLDDQPVPYGVTMAEDERRATIRALDKGTLREITVALDRHEAAEDMALEKKRAMSDTAPASAQTSPSAEP